MKKIEYVIQTATGMHARPAGMFVAAVNKYASKVTVNCNGKEADGRKLFALMKLGAKQNDTLEITVDGSDEDKACSALQEILKTHF